MWKVRGKMSKRLKEEIKVSGEQVVKTVEDLIHAGNVRRITIKDKKGQIVFVIPMTVGVIGAVVAPALAALGAIVAVLSECTITVERDAEDSHQLPRN
jgi:hypothetical protein